jgi:hypothetical protein
MMTDGVFVIQTTYLFVMKGVHGRKETSLLIHGLSFTKFVLHSKRVIYADGSL